MRPAFARFEFPPALAAGPAADWALAALAQHTALAQVRRLLALRDQACNGEADAIRRLRVAARRLRTALVVFAELWQPSQVRAARRALHTLADALGRGRDREVLLARIDQFASDTKGLAAARTAVAAQSASLREGTIAGLTRFEHGGWPARLVTWLSSEPLDLWQWVPNLSPSDAPARASLSRLLLPQIELVWQRAAAAITPTAAAEQHALRIAIKRLRYTMEWFAPCLGTALPPLRDELIAKQDQLGTLHDLDVGVDLLRADLRDAMRAVRIRRRDLDHLPPPALAEATAALAHDLTAGAPIGLLELLRRLAEARQHHHAEFALAWADSEATGLRQRLIAACLAAS